jgi:putative ABC transport system permease protein
MAGFRLFTILLGIFGVVAAVLAAVGIYGVMAYNVSQRTHEIGVRVALGAEARDVLFLVFRQTVLMLAVGLLIGLIGSFALTRLIADQLWGVTPTDPTTFAAVSLLLVVIALLACFAPTRRAVRVDPMIALRYE